jgi:hypothetical protein
MPEPRLLIGVLPTPIQAEARRAYAARDILELAFPVRQRMRILEVKSEWWYIAELAGSKVRGWVPSQYVRIARTALSAIEVRTLYLAWKEKVACATGEKSVLDKNGKTVKHGKITSATFPSIPVEIITCDEMTCVNRKMERPLGACEHEVEALLMGAGEEYCARWLWRESLKWHPDQFVRKCHEEFKEVGAAMGTELFSIIMALAGKERARENARKGVD